jgi:hypothetical protein
MEKRKPYFDDKSGKYSWSYWPSGNAKVNMQFTISYKINDEWQKKNISLNYSDLLFLKENIPEMTAYIRAKEKSLYLKAKEQREQDKAEAIGGDLDGF